MSEARKVAEYRKTLDEVAKSARKSPDKPETGQQRSQRQQEKEGEAAKLGLEIQGEESKGPPRSTPRSRDKDP